MRRALIRNKFSSKNFQGCKNRDASSLKFGFVNCSNQKFGVEAKRTGFYYNLHAYCFFSNHYYYDTLYVWIIVIYNSKGLSLHFKTLMMDGTYTKIWHYLHSFIVSVLIKKILSGQEFNLTEVENLINLIMIIPIQLMKFFFRVWIFFSIQALNYVLLMLLFKYLLSTYPD